MQLDRVSNDITIDVINEVIRLYFGGPLLPLLLFGSCLFLEKLISSRNKHVFLSHTLPALRVRRPETRFDSLLGVSVNNV